MRVQNIENAVRELLQTNELPGLPQLFEHPAGTLRWYLWHGKVMTAVTTLKVPVVSKPRCQELYAYHSNKLDPLANHGHRYQNGPAVSSSRAEGCVDDIGNTRMGKRRRMRWSPHGAHRVAVTPAVVLDGRLSVSSLAA